ncbi:GNAT family N-acetyltransferase [Amycolatopsis sp. DSM 110486]|uniref:GNAT family N-acetyltransferase n=1 Tax=Amycolatopsis sp. DSM 110486 TaxID=2865832 RepID=UPI001C69ABB0|nr:GNAT family N-acetyltransferase [Amycolatopsis sp. DSM 110486]QYN17593.1 GNAT family N-acetyltransferase [Amycolatopsis sp. DSM 110486]
MNVDIELESSVTKTPRVMQMASLFDVPIEEKTRSSWSHNLPIEAKPWNVGLIVGPSGAGKSVLANRLWPESVVSDFPWNRDGALLDDFPAGASIRDITNMLTSVGLGTAPTWMRPFHTLSNGEAFRASIARALLETKELVVIDEFTSVVDRQVAQVASHTVQKAIRRAGRQMVAVSCHYDIEEWLQADWVYHVASGEFQWRSVQPHPPLELRIHPIPRSAWRVFSKYHYLSAVLASSAKCFGAYIGDQCVAFASYRHFPHPRARNIKMAHRVVVLPDYQGLGIAGRLSDWMGQRLYQQGYRFRYSVSHPAMIAMFTKSPRWRNVGDKKTSLRLASTSKSKSLRAAMLNPRQFIMQSFEYAPPAIAEP